MLADVVLDVARGLFIENVGIERRRGLGEDAGIDCVRPGFRPHLDHRERDGLELLPVLHTLALVVLAVDRRFFAVERERDVAAREEREAQSGGLLNRRARRLGLWLSNVILGEKLVLWDPVQVS